MVTLFNQISICICFLVCELSLQSLDAVIITFQMFIVFAMAASIAWLLLKLDVLEVLA